MATLTNNLNILTICLPGLVAPAHASLQIHSAATAREAIDTLRTTNISILVTALRIPVVRPWDLIQKIRTVRSAMKWVLIAPDIDADDERRARSLGVLAICGKCPTLYQLGEFLGSRVAADALDSISFRAALPPRVAAPRVRVAGET